MSENAPAPSPTTDTSTPTPPSTEKKAEMSTVTAGFMSLGGLASLLFYIVYAYGAAKLSYDKFGSIGWAILDFFFAVFYYPYYAIFLSGPQSSYGGRRAFKNLF